MKNIVVNLLVGFGLCAFSAEAANTWLVDAANYGKQGLDGTSWATAYGTIQDAIDATATLAGDTVLVKPGVYDRGSQDDALGSHNRVHVSKKLTIRSSTGERDSVTVVGAWATGEVVVDGIGDNAIRCIGIAQGADGTVIQGFTLKNGGTPKGSDSCKVSGGGVCYLHESRRATTKTYVVDSTIENCTATRGGGARGLVLVRCLVQGCRVYNYGSTSGYSAHRECAAYNCIFRCNRGAFVGYVANTVNCTFYGDSAGTGNLFDNSDANDVYNCVLIPSSGVGKALFHNCVTPAATLTTDDGTNQTGAGDILVGTAVGDARLLSASPAVGGGSVEWLDKIPADYRDTDFYGNPRTTANGTKVSAGAVEASVAVAEAAKLEFGGTTVDGVQYNVTVDGRSARPGYVYATQWPTQYLVGVEGYPEGCGLIRYDQTLDGATVYNRTPPSMKDDTLLVMPHPTKVRKISPYFGKIRWVKDANYGKDGLDGLSEATAYGTIQDAVQSETVVKVLPGDYSRGGILGNGMTNRVTVNVANIRIVSTEGAARTVIRGAADANFESGIGPAAVRCVYISTSSALQGFTLTDSYPCSDEMKFAAFNGGDSSAGGFLADSIVSNNCGNCAGLYSACAVRTLFSDNFYSLDADSTTVRNSRIANCIFLDNRTKRATHNNTDAYNCTFVERKLLDTSCFAANTVNFYNNIYSIARNISQNTTITTMGGCIFDGCTYAKGDPLTFICADPKYAWKTMNDFRLMPDSPAWTQGVTDYDAFSTFATGDFLGNPYVFTNGKPAAGAIQSALPQTTIYVSPDGDDGNDGLSESAPKRTLASALSCASPLDTVSAAPGEYVEGEMLHAYAFSTRVKTQPTVRARAVVPPNVTLRASGSAADTAIVGAAATEPDANGCGPDAVRGVALYSNAKLVGFTVRGGRTGCENTEADDNVGGGILAESVKAVVEDCVLAGNRSLRGGGAIRGTFLRCAFTNNLATENSAALREGKIFGCYVNANVGGSDCAFLEGLGGCTFGPDSRQLSGTDSTTSVSDFGSRTVSNCLFASRYPFSGMNENSTLVRCAYRPEKVGGLTFSAVNCVTGSLERIRLDAAGRPVVGANIAVDAGDVADWTALGFGDRDASGAQRVSNGAMDIGCYEADWNPVYSGMLGRRGSVTVTSADASVRAEGREVVLTSGEIVMTLTAAKAGDYRFPIRLTGEGTLTITLDGTATAYTGPQTVDFVGKGLDIGEHSLTFAYASAGQDDAACIGRGGFLTGLMLILR